MSKRVKGTGVGGVVDAVTGGGLRPITLPQEAEPEAPAEETTPPQEATPPTPVQRTAKTEKSSPPAISGRRGRPPGQKGNEHGPKKKVSLYLSAALYQRYVDRAWDEKCQPGELLERALLDYEKRKWGTPRGRAADNPETVETE